MSAQQQLHPPSSARLAITSLCNVLHQYGIDCLEPETVRQAKFDGPVAGGLWRALHDTVLCVLSLNRCTPSSRAALGRQWEQASLDLLSPDEFPEPAAHMVLHYLASWGAPPALLAAMQPPEGRPFAEARSRPLLLALGWLAAAAGLFERPIRDREPQPDVRALLPPYPEDSCFSDSAQGSYGMAALEAREHVQRLAAPLGTAPASASGAPGSGAAASGGAGVYDSSGVLRRRVGDPFAPAGHDGGPQAPCWAVTGTGAVSVWAEVEAAAQRAVMLCGRVRAKLAALQAATDCRTRLQHALWSRQAASTAPRPLTPFELQLCAQPTAVQRHLAALEAATVALVEQQELAAHGSLFFEWLGSVVAEEGATAQSPHQQPQQGLSPYLQPGGRGGAAAGSPYLQGAKGKGSTASAAGAKAGSAGGPGGGGGGALASLEALPDAGGPAASRLLERLDEQLAAAVQLAGPELAAAEARLGQQQQQAAAPPRGAGVGMAHFLALAEQAVAGRPASTRQGPGGEPPCTAEDLAHTEGSGSGPPGAAAAFGSLLPTRAPKGADPWAQPAGVVDSTTHGSRAGLQDTWQLPPDVLAALSEIRRAQEAKEAHEEEEREAFDQSRYAALLSREFSAATGGQGAGGLAGRGGVAAAAETQRLLSAVLAAARPLARVRAANKTTLTAALGELAEGCMVVGM